MRKFEKPIVYASQCLGFEFCRWNGETISSEAVEKMKAVVQFRTVCPEVEIGLGVPRDPIRVVAEHGQLKLIQPATGRDVTQSMKSFSQQFLNRVTDADGWILKNRSPSCGISDVKIYPVSGATVPLKKSSGFFGAAVLERFGGLAIEDEGRLKNFIIREHFFTKLFTIASFKEVKKSQSISRLVLFQAENKLLLMAYQQQQMRNLGKITANQDKLPFSQMIEQYEQQLMLALAKPARKSSNINVLMHALGYFSKFLTHNEKAFLLELIEKYRAGAVPLSVPLKLIQSWIIRFEQPYLAQQTFFEPFPEQLVEITDSGKGRDY